MPYLRKQIHETIRLADFPPDPLRYLRRPEPSLLLNPSLVRVVEFRCEHPVYYRYERCGAQTALPSRSCDEERGFGNLERFVARQ
jgi:hypothetical protein